MLLLTGNNKLSTVHTAFVTPLSYTLKRHSLVNFGVATSKAFTFAFIRLLKLILHELVVAWEECIRGKSRDPVLIEGMRCLLRLDFRGLFKNT